MDNKTQTILGVVAVGAIGLYLWNSSKKDKVFANAVGIPPRPGKPVFDPKPKPINYSRTAPIPTFLLPGQTRPRPESVFANARGTMKTSNPIDTCKKRCTGVENYNECMYKCTESILNTTYANAGGLTLADISPRPKSPKSNCPRGQVKCPNNNKCYDPRVNYVMNPCA